MGSTVPAGYLICNGSAVSRTAYDKLFQAIGTKYGEGDGSTTFNLPNLIGKFLQGDTTSGTVKEAGLPNITGELLVRPTTKDSSGSGSFYKRNFIREANGLAVASGTFGEVGKNFVGFEASRSSPIYGNSDTVQPPAITSIPCIKAFDSVIDATTVSVAQLSDTKVNKAGDTMTGSLTAPSFIANDIDCSVDSQGDGWIRYSNGLQICWGYTSSNGTPSTNVFGKPFRDMNSYVVNATVTGTTAHGDYTMRIENQSGSYFISLGFRNESSAVPVDAVYTAIGYWK